MKKVLIWLDWFTPGYKAGGPITSNRNLVEQLSEKISFEILTTDTDYCETEPYLDIVSGRWHERGFGRIFYLRRKAGCLARLYRISRAAAMSQAKVWYLNDVYSWCFSIWPLLLARKMRPEKLIVAPRGTLSPQAFSHGSFKKHSFIRLARLFGLYRNVVFQATSQEEAEHIRSHMGSKARIELLNNLPMKSVLRIPSRNKLPGRVRLISAARISPEKNTLFALECLRNCTSSVQFDLYGQIYDQDYWRRCEQVISDLPRNVEVRYCGTLPPERLREKLSEADFLFLPTCGENFGHTILECLQSGVPVIISDRTPWRRLEHAGVGWDLPLEGKQFAKAIESCAAMDAVTYAGYVENALKYAERATDTEQLKKRYLTLFTGQS